jgi:hypothetical protein
VNKLLKKQVLAWAGGIVAGLIVLAIGIAYIVVGVNGRSEVHDTIAQEVIVGSPDMKPGGITTDLKIDMPTCDVAGDEIDTGSEARCFSKYMRVHALVATNGQTYAEMGRFLDANGEATSDEAAAAKDPKTGQPVQNPQRNLWVSERALATGLEMAFFAEQVSLFGIIVGIVAIVIGVGLWVLVLAVWGPTPWKSSEGGSA